MPEPIDNAYKLTAIHDAVHKLLYVLEMDASELYQRPWHGDATGLTVVPAEKLDDLVRKLRMWADINHRYKFTATPELDSEGFTAAVSPWIGLWEAKMALDKEAEQCAKAFWSMFDAPALAPVVDLRNIAFLAEHEAKHLAAGVIYNAVEDARINKLITDTLGDSTFRYTLGQGQGKSDDVTNVRLLEHLVHERPKANPFEGAPVLDQPQQRKLHDMLPPFCENCWGYHHPSESCCFERGAKARERLEAINWERALEASHQRVQHNLRAGRAE